MPSLLPIGSAGGAVLAATEPAPRSGFSFLNLAILLLVVAVAYPLFKQVRRSAAASRRRRWEEAGLVAPSAEDDPDHPRNDVPGRSPGTTAVPDPDLGPEPERPPSRDPARPRDRDGGAGTTGGDGTGRG